MGTLLLLPLLLLALLLLLGGGGGGGGGPLLEGERLLHGDALLVKVGIFDQVRARARRELVGGNHVLHADPDVLA